MLLNYCSDREEIATAWQASPEDAGKRQICVCHRTSLLGSPNNQKKNQCSYVGVYPEQDAEQRGFEAFFAGFLSIPNSQPCARGTFRAISRYLCSLVWQTPKRTDLPCSRGADAPCVSSKAVLFGLYRMYHATAQPICREKWRRET